MQRLLCLSRSGGKTCHPFRPRFYGEKSSQVEWSLAYPGRANISYISLQNVSNRETKSWLCEKGDLPSQVTLGAPTSRLPSGVNSVKARKSEHARALLARAKLEVIIAKDDSVGRVTLFSPYKRSLNG